MMRLVRMTPRNDVAWRNWYGWPQQAEGEQPRPVWRPVMDVVENADGYTVRVDLPGFAPEDVSVEVEDGVLAIASEVTQDDAQDGARYHYRERRSGSFQRKLRLPDSVDVDRIEAAFEHGVLTLSLPLVAETQPKKIKVEVA